MSANTSVSNQVALVTGGNRGIGLAIVKGLAEQGIKVLLGCRSIAEGKSAIEGFKGDIHIVLLDLSSQSSLEQCVSVIDETHPHIDILVNNAGILDETKIEHLTNEILMQSMQVNAMAPFFLMNHYGQRMKEKGMGRIVNVSSGWGSAGGLLSSPKAYGLSKSSLNDMTRIFAASFPDNVKVNAMCPGWVRTRMGGETATRTPDEGAETAIWLATLSEQGPTGYFFRDKRVIDW